MALIVIDVDTGRAGSPEEPLHVLDRVDRDAGLADLPLGPWVIGVEAHLRRQVERDREARLPLLEQVPEPRVRLLGRRHTRVLPHRPQAAAVHRRVDAARERRRPRARPGRARDRSRARGPRSYTSARARSRSRSAVRSSCAQLRTGRKLGHATALGQPWTSSTLASRRTCVRFSKPATTSRSSSRWRPRAKSAASRSSGRNVGVTLELLARSIQARARVRARLGLRVLGLLVRARGGTRGRGPLHRRRSGERAEAADYLAEPGSPSRSGATSATRCPRCRHAGRVRRDLRRHRQGWVPGRLAGGARADPAWAGSTSATTSSGPAARPSRTRRAAPSTPMRSGNTTGVIAADERFISTILPMRDGVMVALRIA